jgi:DNA-directed RNA polymerase subunit M/transcription elongation factor TFIIS
MKKDPSPEHFYLPSVYLWDPSSLLVPGAEESLLDCPKCRAAYEDERKRFKMKQISSIQKSPSFLKTSSWHDTPRRVFDTNGVYYIISTRLRCFKCDTSFVSSGSSVFNLYPREVIEEFPAILSQRSGLDKKLVNLMMTFCDKGIGPVASSAILKEMYTLEYDFFIRCSSYYASN